MKDFDNKKNIRFKEENVKNLSFENESFDNYLSVGVVEHFKKDEQKEIFKEAYRILKNKGIIFIEVPNKYSIWTIFRSLFAKLNPNIWIYQKNMSKKELEYLGKITGFKKIVSFNDDVYKSFKLSFVLNAKNVKGIFNPFYYVRYLFKIISSFLDIAFPFFGYRTYYVGLKK